MTLLSSSRLRRYGLAVLLVAAGSLVSAAVIPVWNDDLLAALIFFPAVTITAWFGGFGPGLVAVAGSALSITYFWLPPQYSFAVERVADLLALTAFCAMGVLVAALHERRLREVIAIVVALRRSERRQATMVKVARTLTRQLDLEAVLDEVAGAATAVFGGEVGFRLLEGDDLVRSRATPGARQAMRRERLKIGESISGRVAATGEPIVTDDTAADERAIPDHRAAHQTDRTRALMCVPIRSGPQILGTLNVYRERGHHFDAPDLEMAMSLAAQAGVALENARLYLDAIRRHREVETLARIGGSLTESLEVSVVSQQIVEGVHQLLGTKTSSLRLLERDGSLRGLAFGGPLRDTLSPGDVIPAGISIGALVIATSRPAWSHEALTDPRIAWTGALRKAFEQAGVGALLAVPLRTRGQVIGVLNVGDAAGRAFAEPEVALLQMFGDQAAVAVENARLYREAVEAYQRLSETQEQLFQSQKMESVGRMAGGLAHNFNNLLTVIRGRAQLLLRRTSLGDRDRGDIEVIEATADRAATLVRQLLAFSRRQMLQRSVLDLNEVVRGASAMLRQLIGEDIELTTVLDPVPGDVLADGAQLEQILVNLAVNARDAMPGGGQLTIETGHMGLDDARVCEIPGGVPGEYVLLRVSDTGIGIDPAIQATIFEPFFTTKDPAHGTGLGLPTVQGTVQQHGGAITVQSALGHGATFTIYLPRAAQEPAAQGPTPDRLGPDARGTETILLVEDEDAVRELTGEMLESAGFTVLTAASGPVALERCRHYAGDVQLLLTDVVMPGMSGPELGEAVRRLRPHIKVVYMSGYSDHPAGSAERLRAKDHMLMKPFTTAALTEIVRQALDERRQKRSG